MNKSESKYFNTAQLMNQALIQLLEYKDIEYISVKEICEKAGVNRSTFYLHYETISDLVEEAIEHITDKFIGLFPQNSCDFVVNIQQVPINELILVREDYLIPYLNFIYDNKGVFKAAVKNPNCMKTFSRYSRLKQYVFEPIMERFQIPKDVRNYWTCYYINGIWAIIEEWLKNDCRETVEQIETIIISCVIPKDTYEKWVNELQ
jgi:AcrR family transcriptional regulator